MSYVPHVWKDGEIITAERMNALEEGVKNEQAGPQGPAGPSYTLPSATTSKLGGVKQAANVAEAAGENVTKAEFKSLLDSLKAAGIMAGG